MNIRIRPQHLIPLLLPLGLGVAQPPQAHADTTVTFPASSDNFDYTFYPYMFFDGDEVVGQRLVDTDPVEAVSFDITADAELLFCETEVELSIGGSVVASWMVQPVEPVERLSGVRVPLSLSGGPVTLRLTRVSPVVEGCGSLILDEDVGTVTFHGPVEVVDQDGDGFSEDEDCDDRDPLTYPGADEPCDGKDNDCDETIDEEGESRFYPDADGDGYGVLADSLLSCDPPPGYVSLPGDCDDEEATVNPGATETCDGVDENCNGVADDGAKETFFLDQDHDGWGTVEDTVLSCSAPPGYVADPGDCDDTTGAIHPQASEICDGVDNDCNFLVDDRDVDGDGFTAAACGGDDCNDNRADVNPGADELPADGADNDCDGLVDEASSTGCGAADGEGSSPAALWMGLAALGLVWRRRLS